MSDSLLDKLRQNATSLKEINVKSRNNGKKTIRQKMVNADPQQMSLKTFIQSTPLKNTKQINASQLDTENEEYESFNEEEQEPEIKPMNFNLNGIKKKLNDLSKGAKTKEINGENCQSYVNSIISEFGKLVEFCETVQDSHNKLIKSHNKQILDTLKDKNNIETRFSNINAKYDEMENQVQSLETKMDCHINSFYIKFMILDKREIDSVKCGNATETDLFWTIINYMNIPLSNVRLVRKQITHERKWICGKLEDVTYLFVKFADNSTANYILSNFIIINNKIQRKEIEKETRYYAEIPISKRVKQLMTVCHKLKLENLISSYFVQDDSVKVRYIDINRENKTFKVTSYGDIDALRQKIGDPESGMPTKYKYGKIFQISNDEMTMTTKIDSKRPRNADESNEEQNTTKKQNKEENNDGMEMDL
ncbi:hypothetical protein PVAND_004047 [Polypedilum vanderplanki]|uniref:Uncharacterized protein n=1 Tax=Polypedilum vanderplanki TaxID=319348 RepID=A0A9J6BWZ1_POLVA|nr:hypothetical protein PVAND_004047 [Polypedilum vanderplanki]